MLAQSSLQTDCDIKSPARRDSTTHSRHGDHGDILYLHVCCRLGNKHETLVEKVQKTFVCLDRAFDSAMAVVTDEVFRRHDDFFTRQASENLCDDLVYRFLVSGLELVFVALV